MVCACEQKGHSLFYVLPSENSGGIFLLYLNVV